jgi:multidrug efflux pump subunit AcrB
MIDDALYNAFGQRQISTIFTQLNQYRVILEVKPEFQQNPDALNRIYVRSPTGDQVPLAAFTHFERTVAPLAISHQGQFPAVTISFDPAPGVSLGAAVNVIERARRDSTARGHRDAVRGAARWPGLARQRAAPDPGRGVHRHIVLGVLYELDPQ